MIGRQYELSAKKRISPKERKVAPRSVIGHIVYPDDRKEDDFVERRSVILGALKTKVHLFQITTVH